MDKILASTISDLVKTINHLNELKLQVEYLVNKDNVDKANVNHDTVFAKDEEHKYMLDQLRVAIRERDQMREDIVRLRETLDNAVKVYVDRIRNWSRAAQFAGKRAHELRLQVNILTKQIVDANYARMLNERQSTNLMEVIHGLEAIVARLTKERDEAIARELIDSHDKGLYARRMMEAQNDRDKARKSENRAYNQLERIRCVAEREEWSRIMGCIMGTDNGEPLNEDDDNSNVSEPIHTRIDNAGNKIECDANCTLYDNHFGKCSQAMPLNKPSKPGHGVWVTQGKYQGYACWTCKCAQPPLREDVVECVICGTLRPGP